MLRRSYKVGGLDNNLIANFAHRVAANVRILKLGQYLAKTSTIVWWRVLLEASGCVPISPRLNSLSEAARHVEKKMD